MFKNNIKFEHNSNRVALPVERECIPFNSSKGQPYKSEREKVYGRCLVLSLTTSSGTGWPSPSIPVHAHVVGYGIAIALHPCS